MSSATETTHRERVRIYATGSCEGFEKLRDSLTNHPEIEMVGASVGVADGAGALGGGPRAAVSQAPGGASLPADELASIREHTRAPILLVASNGSAGLLEEALESGVSDLPLPPPPPRKRRFGI